MSEKNTNHESPEQNVAHDNIEHSDSILEETMKEFDPKHNSGEEMTIENEIDIDTFKARIAELEGEVKQAKDTAPPVPMPKLTMHKNAWSKRRIRVSVLPCRNLPKSY